MPVNVRNVSTWRLECTHDLPLYWVVARLNPTRLGRRKSLREASHVPSPTDIVFEVYELLPGGDSCGEGDMVLLEKELLRSSPGPCGDVQISSLYKTTMRQLNCGVLCS